MQNKITEYSFIIMFLMWHMGCSKQNINVSTGGNIIPIIYMTLTLQPKLCNINSTYMKEHTVPPRIIKISITII